MCRPAPARTAAHLGSRHHSTVVDLVRGGGTSSPRAGFLRQPKVIASRYRESEIQADGTGTTHGAVKPNGNVMRNPTPQVTANTTISGGTRATPAHARPTPLRNISRMPYTAARYLRVSRIDSSSSSTPSSTC